MSTDNPAYKQLFAYPEMVTDLLRGYIREAWVGQIDFATPAGFQPQLRYLLLDEGRIADHPDLSLRNLASALFRLEFSPAPEDFRTVWDRLFDWISHPNQDSLRRAFIAWANRIGLRRHLPNLNVGELHDAKEISTMLATHTTTDWTAQWTQQGQRQGESRLLRRQLQRRFGANLPDWVDDRLNNAELDQLEMWGEAILDARTLEAVFGES